MRYPCECKAALSVALLVVAVLDSIIASADTLPRPFQVIPHPREVELLNGAGLAFEDLRAVSLEKDCSRPVMGPLLSCLLQSDVKGKGVLLLELRAASGASGSTEAYTLTISAGIARVRAQGQSGLFYGCQTLEQLLEDARDTGLPIPACKIKDYPAYQHRAVHFDVKHHIDSVNYYYNCIDRLARYKVNAIIFEFEHKLRYRRQPCMQVCHRTGSYAHLLDDMIFEHAGLYESVHKPEAGEAETADAWKKGEPILDVLFDRFPRDCVYMRWNHSTTEIQALGLSLQMRRGV